MNSAMKTAVQEKKQKKCVSLLRKLVFKMAKLNSSQIVNLLMQDEEEDTMSESQIIIKEVEHEIDEEFNLTDTTVNNSLQHNKSSSSPEVRILSEQNRNISALKKRKLRKKSILSKENEARTENQDLRMKGQAYQGRTTDKNIGVVWLLKEAKVIGPTCTSAKCIKSKLTRNCGFFTDEQRYGIFTEFWSDMNWTMKKLTVKMLINISAPKRRRDELENTDPRRKCTYNYHLRLNVQSEPKQVCKNMFLSTLGISEKFMRHCIETTIEKLDHEMSLETPWYHASMKLKPRREHLVKFLEEIPKLPSHYSRQSSTKLYLERSFTSVRHVYRVYSEDAEMNELVPLSRGTFDVAYKDANMGIFKPRKDRCDFCVAFEMPGTKITKEEYDAHIAKQKLAQAEKSKDKFNLVPGRVVLAVDVQAVLMSPKIDVSAMYYRTKLCVHNYTVYDLQTADVMCYVWHEGEGGLDSTNFASMLVDKLECIVRDKPNTNEIIIYSDGCPYQNRCCTLSNALLLFSINSGVTVIQKYLEKGHTMMEVDSVHAVVERRVRKKDIGHPFDYVSEIVSGRLNKNMSPPPYHVQYLSHLFFKEYKNVSFYSSIRPGTKKGDKTVTDLRALMYVPSGQINYKLSFTENEWTSLPLSHKIKKPTDTVTTKYTQKLLINADKYRHLQELKFCIPEEHHLFYDNLPHH